MLGKYLPALLKKRVSLMSMLWDFLNIWAKSFSLLTATSMANLREKQENAYAIATRLIGQFLEQHWRRTVISERG
jgi:hypothetical protein